MPENIESIKVSKRAYVKKKDESVLKKSWKNGTRCFSSVCSK